jgi:hypothetical protein
MKLAIRISIMLTMILIVFRFNGDALSYTITPYWANMNSITLDLYFDGANSMSSAVVTKINGVTTLLSGTLTVYRKSGSSWVTVGSASNNSTSTLAIVYSFNATSGVQYKASLTVYAYSATGSESETVTKIGTCP